MNKRLFVAIIFTLLCLTLASHAKGAILDVGPSGTYAKISDAVTASSANDTIRLQGEDALGNQVVYYFGQQSGQDPGTSPTKSLNFVADSSKKRPLVTLASGQTMPGSHGFIRPSLPGGTFTFDHIEFSGARCSNNCTPIWFEAIPISVTINDCVFHDNDNGELISNESVASLSRIWYLTITHSEFYHNGRWDGQTHNVYVGAIRQLTFKYNYTHDSFGGQQLKTRAAVSYVMYNNIMDGWDSGYVDGGGASNYQVDIPSCGRLFLIGNLIHQAGDKVAVGVGGVNTGIIVYGAEESACTAATTSNNNYKDLYIINNTVVNDDTSGVFVRNYEASFSETLINNVFAGPGTVLMHVNTGQSNPANNSIYTTVAGANFLDAAHLDFRLASNSTARGAATSVGTLPVGGGADSFDSTPTEQYAHPLTSIARNTVVDNGALEFGTTGTAYVSGVTAETLDGDGTVRVFFGTALIEGSGAITGYNIYRATVGGSPSLIGTASASAKFYDDTTGTRGVPYNYSVTPVSSPSAVTSNSAIGGSSKAPSTSIGTDVAWYYMANTKFSTQICTGSACTFYWYWVAGAAFDDSSGCYYVWGGDAGQHQGNEIYRFCGPPPVSWSIFRAKSTTTSTGEFATSPNTDPSSRKLFMGMVWAGDRIFAHSGYLSGDVGTAYRHTYDPLTNTWTSAASGLSQSLPTGSAAYNSSTGKVYWNNSFKLYEYDKNAQTYTQLLANSGLSYTEALVYVPPPYNKLFAFGNAVYKYFNPATSYTSTNLPLSCVRMGSQSYPAVDYDSTNHTIVYWDKGRYVVTLNLDTMTCSEQIIVGAPVLGGSGAGMPGNGFRYSSQLRGFWVPLQDNNIAFLVTSATATNTWWIERRRLGRSPSRRLSPVNGVKFQAGKLKKR